MKVSKLIKELKKMPQDLEVAVAAHDNSELEIQQGISFVSIVDFDEVRRTSPVQKGDLGITGRYVILR